MMASAPLTSSPSPVSDSAQPATSRNVNVGIGPQGTCAPVGPQTWGNPTNSRTVNAVAGRNPNAIQWEIDSECTLIIHSGTSPDYTYNSIPWDSYDNVITKIRFEDNVTLYTTSMTGKPFAHMPLLNTVQMDGTLHLTQWAGAYLFAEDTALSSFTGVNGFETSQATDLRYMFYKCSGLTSLTLPDTFNTANVINMSYMFDRCTGLTSLTLPKTFTTSNVFNMYGMFYNCSSLVSLDLSTFDNRKVLSEGSDMREMLSGTSNLRELWLGPYTYLARTGRDSIAGLSPTTGWVELPASGGQLPVNDMRARTARNNKKNPEGHYVRAPLFILTVDYNNGEANHIETHSLDTSTSGSRRITWGTHTAPAGKVFDRWDFTTNDPIHVTFSNDTVSWTAAGNVIINAKVTAQWRTLDQPTLNLIVHADGTPNPSGAPGPWTETTVTMPATAKAGDGIKLESLNGSGHTDNCTPAAGTSSCTFRHTIDQLRDSANFDAPYHLKASVTAFDHRDTDTPVTGPSIEEQRILPYIVVSYKPGTEASGTPPATVKALTDTAAQTAQLTVSGPSPIVRPAHSLFKIWQADHGTVRPGTTPVAASLGISDINGRTAVTLTAIWKLLEAPDHASATRDPATNKVTISGTAKPRDPTDTVRICHPAISGGRQECHNVTPESIDTNGNSLPFDGATEHPWKVTLPAETPGGDWIIDATLITQDPAYPAGSQMVESATTHISVHIPPSLGMNTLPLTGGQNRRTLLLLASALAAAMLLLAAIRNLRGWRRKS